MNYLKNKLKKHRCFFEDEQITYRELNNRSSQLTYYLSIKLGVGSENLATICFKRSIELIVSIIGIVKLEAGYAPIDPQYPIEKQQYILQDIIVKLILY